MMTSIGLHALVVELEMTPDSQSGSCGFKSRRGFHRIEVRLGCAEP
jgi:hypothetical protein